MHNEPVIALYLAGIGLIVVNAMAVKCKRRVAKEHRGIERHPFAVRFINRCDRWRDWRGLILAVDQFLPLGQNQCAALTNVVAYAHKGQWSAATRFAQDAVNCCRLRRPDTGKKWLVKHQLARRPHPARQAKVRQEAALGGVAVAPQGAGGLRVPKIDLVKERWKWVACGDVRRIAQGRAQRICTGDIHDVGLRLAIGLGCHARHIGWKMSEVQMPKLDQLDHLVLTVTDLDTTIAFYRDILGMKAEVFHPSDGTVRTALLFGQQKINLHPVERPFSPHAADPKPGSADLCFLSKTKLSDWQDHIRKLGVKVIDGPIARTGATGPILSIYLRDPDGNLIEISNNA